MIDMSRLRYRLLLVTDKGKEIDITSAATDLGWEEGESELAQRISFTLCNTEYGGGLLSGVAKPGCAVIITADWGTGKAEVARGRINDWDPQFAGGGDAVSITAYDDLINLQGSQDNRYYSAGTGTKAAIASILDDWGITLGEYKGPDIAHAKTLFKAERLSDILLQLLDDAGKKGGGQHIIRSNKGKVDVLPEGGNPTIYHFSAGDNVTVARDTMSVSSLVTRVKVVGKEDSAGKQAVEAIIDGQTQYGIRQRIYVRSEDDTLETAKSAAREIIGKEGQPDRILSISAPDVPTLRKGDKIHVQAGTLNGYYIVRSIRHNASERTMRLGLKQPQPPRAAQASTEAAAPQQIQAADFRVGDVVDIIESAENYYPGGARISDWVKNYHHTITQITYNGYEVVKGGAHCVLLGGKSPKRQQKMGGSSAEINAWTDVAILRKVQ